MKFLTNNCKRVQLWQNCVPSGNNFTNKQTSSLVIFKNFGYF